MQIGAPLNNAIRSVRRANGTQRFELQSLLVFCVAESIRSDLIAGRIEATIRARPPGACFRGTARAVGSMLAQARAWGQSGDAVWASLAPDVRRSANRLPSAPPPRQKPLRTHGRNPDRRRAALTARGVKVLKSAGLTPASA